MPTLEGANAYFANTLRNEAWLGQEETRREVAIREAAGMISRLTFRPQPPAQALDSAVYEQALCLLTMPPGEQARQQAVLAGIKSRSLGKASESYTDPEKLPGYIDGQIFCPASLSWLAPYLSAGKTKTGRLVCR